jgi:glycosyl transferase family 2
VAARREPVSIVTVFNDPEVRRSCLDRSIEAHRDEAPAVEYLPIDNTGGAFASAGAALNHGAAQARHEYLVFVHQDVYLHSLAGLEEAAGMLADDEGIGLLGAVGPTAEGRFLGRMRDRVFLLGEPTARPAVVDSVDEALFVIPRRVLEREPLTQAPELAWHAYAVEFGLRARSRGLRVCAVDIPLTHNSLTINLDRLDVAYDAVAAMHPGGMPVFTPQGPVGGPERLRDRTKGFLRAHRWRYRWLRESVNAHAGRRAAGGSPCVIGDIRLEVDGVAARSPAPLLVVNLDQPPTFADERPGPLELMREGRPILVTSRPLDGVAEAVAAAPPGSPALITNLGLEDVRRLAPQLPSEQRIVGFRTSIGYWILIGVAPAALPEGLRSAQATPLGMRRLG